MFVLFVMRSYLIEVRGLKLKLNSTNFTQILSYLIEVRGLKHPNRKIDHRQNKSYLIEVRGLKHVYLLVFGCLFGRIL